MPVVQMQNMCFNFICGHMNSLGQLIANMVTDLDCRILRQILVAPLLQGQSINQ